MLLCQFLNNLYLMRVSTLTEKMQNMNEMNSYIGYAIMAASYVKYYFHYYC